MTEIRKPKAYQLAEDEKLTLVMLYTANTLIRGEVITKESIRVSIWLRTQAMPEFMHMLNAHVLVFGGAGPAKQVSYSELVVPTGEVLAVHLVPPAHDPLDYDESEVNRVTEPVSALIGTFVFDGHMRLSTQSNIPTAIGIGRTPWLSLYDLAIHNPHLSAMGVLKVPMAMVRQTHVLYGIHTGENPSATP